MKAARWHGPRDVRVETVPDPTPGPGDLVLRVDWCGICGTDVEEYLTGPHWIPTEQPNPLTGARAPITLGHEFAGEVVALGRDVRDLRVGDSVAPDTLIYCGRCYWCRRHQVHLCESLAALGLMADGGLAEFCVAPAAMCLTVPPSLPPDHAAMAETLLLAGTAISGPAPTSMQSEARLQRGASVVFVSAISCRGCKMSRAFSKSADRPLCETAMTTGLR